MFVFVFRLRWLRRGCASDLRKAADRRVKMEGESREPARAVIAANRVLSVHHQTNLSPPPSLPPARSPLPEDQNIQRRGVGYAEGVEHGEDGDGVDGGDQGTEGERF